MTPKKKLIEVVLPLEAINVASAGEKSIRTSLIAVLVVALFVAVGVAYGIDRLAWQARWREGGEGSYFTALAALSALAAAAFTAAAAFAALVYVWLTYGLWKETAHQVEQQRRTTETALMQSLMVEYDAMRDDIKIVRDYYLDFPADAEGIKVFKDGWMATGGLSGGLLGVDRARFRVSRFFVRLRKLSKAGYLDRRIIATALGKEAIEEVFLDDIDPLDQVIASLRKRHESIADRDFYRDLLRDMKKVQSTEQGTGVVEEADLESEESETA